LWKRWEHKDSYRLDVEVTETVEDRDSCKDTKLEVINDDLVTKANEKGEKMK